MRLAWVLDGDLAQRTGGTIYDREVVDGLRRAGDEVRVVSLPGRLLRELRAFRPDVVVGGRALLPRARGRVPAARQAQAAARPARSPQPHSMGDRALPAPPTPRAHRGVSRHPRVRPHRDDEPGHTRPPRRRGHEDLHRCRAPGADPSGDTTAVLEVPRRSRSCSWDRSSHANACSSCCKRSRALAGVSCSSEASCATSATCATSARSSRSSASASAFLLTGEVDERGGCARAGKR